MWGSLHSEQSSRSAGVAFGGGPAGGTGLFTIKFTIDFAGRAGFVYVEDVANLVKMYLKNSLKGAITANINGISKDVREIVSIIKKNIPVAKIGFNDKPLSVVDEIIGDEPYKYFKEFKYTTLQDGIKKTIDFY